MVALLRIGLFYFHLWKLNVHKKLDRPSILHSYVNATGIHDIKAWNLEATTVSKQIPGRQKPCTCINIVSLPSRVGAPVGLQDVTLNFTSSNRVLKVFDGKYCEVFM